MAEEKKKFEVIDSVKDVTEDKKDTFSKFEVVLNLLVQKNVYEDIFKQLAKDVDISGFRKGKAPRDMIEPKVYPKAKEQTQRVLLEAVLQELPRYVKSEMGKMMIDVLEVENLAFTIVDTPMKITLRLLVLAPKLGNVSKIKIDTKKLDKIEVTEEDVEKALNETWQNWQQNTKEEEKKEKYKEMNDAWVKEELKVEGVNTIDELKQHLRKHLQRRKTEIAKEELLKELFDKAVEKSKIEVPEEYVREIVGKEMENVEKQVQQYGITVDQYLQSQGKTKDDFKEEIAKNIRQRVSHDILFQLYRDEKGIKIDKNSDEDKKYVNVAQQHVQPPQVSEGQPQPSQQDVLAYAQRVIGAAVNVKTQVYMAREVGLELEDQSTEEEKAQEDKPQDQKPEQTEQKNESEESKPKEEKKESKILTP